VAIGSLATATKAALSAANENPTNPSTGTGFAKITFDAAAHTMRVQATYTGLFGNVTAAHIVPEPGSAALLATALLGVALSRGVARRRAATAS
jgi:hypothetical protein